MKKITSLFFTLLGVALFTSASAQVCSGASYGQSCCDNSSSDCSMGDYDQAPSGGNNGKVVEIPNTDYFYSLISDSDSRNTIADRHIILDFTATWCGPCQQFKPMYEFVAEDYAGMVDFYRVDVDKNKELAQMFEVSSIPALVYIPIAGDPIMEGVPEDLYDRINSVFGLDVQL